MFAPGASGLGERVVRALLVYAFLLIAVRIFGRRELGQMTSFDIILLLSLSNILQNAMIGEDNSVIGGIVGASVLLGVNLAVAAIVFRSRRAERVVEGTLRVLLQDGVVKKDALRKELLTEEDVKSAVRKAGYENLDDVRLVYSEPNGQISVIPKK
jgi:uncharacterized membrane protein YcaP (DUF421 family)